MTDREVIVSASDLAARVIEPSDFVADTEAFVDVRLHRSQGKASYSMIGPGVSQNPDQSVNLTIPHGFNVGGASMPSGVINNQHMHFTAEVFICTRGKWRMNIGEQGGQHLDITEGTVFSVPTWVFRGFENIGPDDGFLYALLGGDDTGGILWAPHVLEQAAETGLYLDESNGVLDATDGDDVSEAISAVSADQLNSNVDTYSDAELTDRAVACEQLEWSNRSLLSAVLPGHECAMAPVIGHGLTEDRHHRPPITSPHEFSVEWLEVAPGSSTGRHRHPGTQVLILVEGSWDIVLNAGDEETARPADVGSVVSVPEGAWRDFVNTGDGRSRAIVVCGGNGPTRLEWAPEVTAAAAGAGWVLDASGYLAPAELVGSRAI